MLPVLLTFAAIARMATLAGWFTASGAGRLAWTICLLLLFTMPLLTPGSCDWLHSRLLAIAGTLVVVTLLAGNLYIMEGVQLEPKNVYLDNNNDLDVRMTL